MQNFCKKSEDDNAETHTYRSYDYTVTVSDNPEKVIISDNFTGEKKKIRDCNSLEITLLALVNSLCKGKAHEYKES